MLKAETLKAILDWVYGPGRYGNFDSALRTLRAELEDRRITHASLEERLKTLSDEEGRALLRRLDARMPDQSFTHLRLARSCLTAA